MGEIADMMIDGTLCEGCGVYLDDGPSGYPRRCADCEESERIADIHANVVASAKRHKVKCHICGKRVSPEGLKQHKDAKHPVERSK